MKLKDIDVVPLLQMSTIGSSKYMYFGLINSVHCQHPERCALLLNFIKVFAIDITEAYRWRLLHVQYIHFRKSWQILVYCSMFYLSL